MRALGERHAGLQVVVESPALAAALLAAGVPPAVRADEERSRPLARRAGLWLGVRGLPSSGRACAHGSRRAGGSACPRSRPAT